MGTKLKEKKRVHIDKVQWYTSKRSESEASKIDRNRELPNPFRFTSLSLSLAACPYPSSLLSFE